MWRPVAIIRASEFAVFHCQVRHSIHAGRHSRSVPQLPDTLSLCRRQRTSSRLRQGLEHGDNIGNATLYPLWNGRHHLLVSVRPRISRAKNGHQLSLPPRSKIEKKRDGIAATGPPGTHGATSKKRSGKRLHSTPTADVKRFYENHSQIETLVLRHESCDESQIESTA